MKKISNLLLLGLMVFVFSNCKKETMQGDNAQLIGIDFRRCAHPVCGGYWIEIDQDTLRFLDIPENSNIGELDVDTAFPIPVDVTWKWPEDETLKIAEDLIVVEQLSKK